MGIQSWGNRHVQEDFWPSHLRNIFGRVILNSEYQRMHVPPYITLLFDSMYKLLMVKKKIAFREIYQTRCCKSMHMYYNLIKIKIQLKVKSKTLPYIK